MTKMSACIISNYAMSRRHGTGAQLLRIFNHPDSYSFHLYLTAFYSGVSECANSFRLEDPRYLGRGRRYVKHIERFLGMAWWNGNAIRAEKLRGLLRRKNL